MAQSNTEATRRKETPGSKLARVLDELGISKRDFAVRVKRHYQTVWRWCNDQDFGQESRDLCTSELRLPKGHFDPPPPSPAELRRRKREGLERLQAAQQARSTLDTFLDTELAQLLTAPDVLTLRSIRFSGPNKPSPAFYEAVALALLRHIRPNQIGATAELNAKLDAAIARKRPRRHR